MIMTIALVLLTQNQAGAPWEGLQKDSYVIYKITSGGKTTEEKRTLLRLEAGGTQAVIKIEPKDGEAKEETVDLTVPPMPDKAATKGEKYQVDNLNFECTVVEERTNSGPSVNKVKKWISADAPTPGGILREETKSYQNSLLARTTVNRLLHVSIRVRVESVTLKGWESEVTSEEGQKKTQELIWWSREVPGWVAKKETKVSEGKTVTTTLTEVIKFERK